VASWPSGCHVVQQEESRLFYEFDDQLAVLVRIALEAGAFSGLSDAATG
jgi:hypothetical protein